MKLKQVIFENDIETKQGDWFADLAMDIITEVKDGFEKLFSTDTDIQKYSSLNRVEINYIPGEFTKPEENFFKLRETVDVGIHPNKKGYEKIVEENILPVVKPYLQKRFSK
jgi:hypothetical protein